MAAPVLLALGTIFGKAAGSKLVDVLSAKPKGSEKLEKAADVMLKGVSVVEALKQTFGDDFLKTINEVTGQANKAGFFYEAGGAGYIRIENANSTLTTQILRDELNINLDRLALVGAKSRADLSNHFNGALKIWQGRVLEVAHSEAKADAMATFEAMGKLLDGQKKSFKDLYRLVSATGLGGVGTLMVIAGVLMATGTGVGIVTAISMFLFGIPWVAVGSLVLPGALMVLLAARTVTEDNAISVCVGMAYKLLNRLDTSSS